MSEDCVKRRGGVNENSGGNQELGKGRRGSMGVARDGDSRTMTNPAAAEVPAPDSTLATNELYGKQAMLLATGKEKRQV